MPSPRKPTQLLVLNGGLAHDPKRYADRMNEPASNGPIGDAPTEFSEAYTAIWNEIVDLIPTGVLQKSDRIIVELVVTLIHQLRTGELNMAGITQLRQALASLGMTPADRSRVSAAPQETQHDPWTDFTA